MAEINPDAADAALESGVTGKPAADVVALPIAEVARLRDLEKAHAGLEKSTAAALIERDLSVALDSAGNLMAGTSSQLLKLWADDFTARRVDGRWVVEARGGGTVQEVVKSRLASTEYAHFIKAGHVRGGSGSSGGSVPAPTGQAAETQSLGHRMLAQGVATGHGTSPMLAKYRQN